MRPGRRFGRLLGNFKRQDGSNLRPKRGPSWSQNGIKIDAKIDQKVDAFQHRFLKRFWWILEGKMDASWHQNGFKNRSYLEEAAKPKVPIKSIEFQ